MNIVGVIKDWMLILTHEHARTHTPSHTQAVFLLIGKTSALTMNIAGVIKDWMLIFFSFYLFKAPLTSMNLAGYAFCCSGVRYCLGCFLKRLMRQATLSVAKGCMTVCVSCAQQGLFIDREPLRQTSALPIIDYNYMLKCSAGVCVPVHEAAGHQGQCCQGVLSGPQRSR